MNAYLARRYWISSLYKVSPTHNSIWGILENGRLEYHEAGWPEAATGGVGWVTIIEERDVKN